MITTQNIQLAKNQLKIEHSPKIVKAQSPEFNRKMLESANFDILLQVETTGKKDKLKKLDAGFNHVLAKIAAKNKISLGIDLENLREEKDKKQKAILLARIKENIKTCRKAKCQITLLNEKDAKDAKAFLQSLGASTIQTKSTTF